MKKNDILNEELIPPRQHSYSMANPKDIDLKYTLFLNLSRLGKSEKD